jgi:hypothetical protein
VSRGVVDDVPEVPAHRGLAADVDLEDLHALELVDDGHALDRRQLARVPASGARQAMHAREVAGVGQLPGEADRGVEPGLEVVDRAGALIA